MSQETDWILSDKLKRKLYIKYEFQRRLYKASRKNSSTKPAIRAYINYKMAQYPRFSSSTQQINRCIISGRSMGVLRFSRFSRFVINDQMRDVGITNLRRSTR